MRKKIIAVMIAVVMLMSQLIAPGVYAGKEDVKYAIDQLHAMPADDKAVILKELWDYGVDTIANNYDTITVDAVYNSFYASMENVNMEHLIGDGVDKVSVGAIKTLIGQLIDQKAVVKSIYDNYETYMDSAILKEALGLPGTATRGEVVLAMTDPNNSVPILALDNGQFVRNGDLGEAFSRILAKNLGNDSLQTLISILLVDMNGKVDVLAGKINDNIATTDVTVQNVIYVLDLYNMYESDPTAPVFVSSVPAAGAVNVSTTASITVTYNKSIYSGANNKIADVTLSTGGVTVASTKSINGNILTVVPNALNNSTSYTLNVPQGAVVGEVLRQADPVTFTFTTAAAAVIPPVTPDEPVVEEPEDEDEEPVDEEDQTIIDIVEGIIDSIIEEEITQATGGTLTDLSEDIRQKIQQAASLIPLIDNPQIVSNLTTDLINRSTTLSAKLLLSNDLTNYDGLVNDVRTLAQTAVNTIGRLKVVPETEEPVQGRDVSRIVLGEKAAGEAVDADTKALLDLIVSTTALLNGIMSDAGIDAVIEPTLTLDARLNADSVAATVQIPGGLLNAAGEAGVTAVNVVTDVASFSIPSQALSGVGNDSVVELNADKVDTQTLTFDQQALVGDSPVFDLYITVDGEPLTQFNGFIKVTVPYTLKDGEDPDRISVFFINENNEPENVMGKYDAATGTVTFETNHFSLYTIMLNTVRFIDVASNFWAVDFIESMAAKNIIRGIGNNMYAPSRNVTRAEFASLIVRTFNLLDRSAVNTFSDVKATDWFYYEVATAAKLGIVQGRPGGIFSPNDNITREEMAKMLSNVLVNVAKKSVPANAATFLASFTDNSSIADYAKDSVAMGARFGFFQGRPDGSFAPKDNANRAEAAKLIYMLFNLD